MKSVARWLSAACGIVWVMTSPAWAFAPVIEFLQVLEDNTAGVVALTDSRKRIFQAPLSVGRIGNE